MKATSKYSKLRKERGCKDIPFTYRDYEWEGEEVRRAE